MTESADFLLSSYDYDLPEERIAQVPLPDRAESRLLSVSRRGDPALRHRRFRDLPEELPAGALLVANNSRVLPARLKGTRSTGGRVEFLLLTPIVTVLASAAPAGGGLLEAEAEGLLRCGGHPAPGERLSFGEGISVRLLESGPFGRWRAVLGWRGDLAELFERAGSVPLPPYIRRAPVEADRERYQTVYARRDRTGSVAAPTAGLHFTPELRERLLAEGFLWRELTLYVGYGTFSPVRCEDIRGHAMHGELVDVPEETAAAVAEAKREGRPVVAVGTTSVRALEGAFAAAGAVAPWHGVTDVFLHPGNPPKVVDGLVTNFHLPGSTLIMLVASLMGRERTLGTYRTAVREGYRFFSYGDAMLVRP